MKKKLMIEGMTCMHCVMHVKNALMEIEGVSSVEVDLEGKNAIIELVTDGVEDEKLKGAVTEAGYDVTGIENV